jgi:5-methylcytosine-specific restriction endonuclease McrA
MKKRWKDPVFREMMKNKAKENWHSGKTSISREGQSLSIETKKKMSESRRKYFKRIDIKEYKKYHIGKKQTEETKEKHKIDMKNLWKDPIERSKREKINRNISSKPEVKDKISKALKNKPKSPEHNRKVSEAIKKWWADPKNREKMIKEKAYHWKGGITPLRKLIRHCAKYKEWRLSVMERDDYTCQSCSKRGGWLEVDHFPKLFSEIFHEYNFKSLNDALNCDELWNINNGRTLCRKCHRE